MGMRRKQISGVKAHDLSYDRTTTQSKIASRAMRCERRSVELWFVRRVDAKHIDIATSIIFKPP
jgi:hypothetical protein